MYCQSLNAKQLSHYHAEGPDYQVNFIEEQRELASLTGSITVIGAGTNRLWIHPQHDTIICLKALDQIHFLDDGLVQVGAGVLLPRLIKEAKELGWGGLEFTWPIPASLGGALAQNFGAYQAHLGSFVRTMSVFDLITKKIVTVVIENESDWFSYRQSKLKTEGLILLEATLELIPMAKDSIQTLIENIQLQRSQLYSMHNTCGSVFKNPPQLSAGKLLDECGLKGFRIGPVQTSTKHANIIVADPNAKTQDISDLISHLKQTVIEKRGIALELELAVY